MDAGIGDIILLTAEGTLGLQRILSTFHYRCSSIGTSFGLPQYDIQEELIDAVRTAVTGLEDQLLSLLPSNYTLNRWTAQTVAPNRVVRFNGATIDLPGTSTVASGTSNLAAVITRRGAAGTRKDVGSLHLPYADAVSESVTGVIPAVIVAGMDDLAALMLTTQVLASTYEFEPVLYHRGSVPNYSLIEYAFAQSTVRVMRRRTVGVGI